MFRCDSLPVAENSPTFPNPGEGTSAWRRQRCGHQRAAARIARPRADRSAMNRAGRPGLKFPALLRRANSREPQAYWTLEVRRASAVDWNGASAAAAGVADCVATAARAWSGNDESRIGNRSAIPDCGGKSAVVLLAVRRLDLRIGRCDGLRWSIRRIALLLGWRVAALLHIAARLGSSRIFSGCQDG